MADTLFAEHPVALPAPSSSLSSLPGDSTVAVVDSPPDPNTIPIHPPNGTPPPPTGHLLPEVEMAEAAQDLSTSSHASSTPAPPDVVLNGVNGTHSDDEHPATTVASDDGAVDMNIDDDNDSDAPLPEPLSSVSAPVAHVAFPFTAPVDNEQHMSDDPVASGTDASTPAATQDAYGVPNGNANSPTGSVRPYPDTVDDDGQPPAKRARKLSDPDIASLNHTASPSTTLNDESKPFIDPAPGAIPVSVPPPPAVVEHVGPPTLTPSQYRFITSTVRTLKRVKEAGPFLNPVDPVALAIPHYPAIVKNPMDLGTIERKVSASNPNRPDLNAAQGRYRSAAEFIADVHLVFYNCLIFNGPEHPVTLMGKRVESIFEKQIKNLPSIDEPTVKKEASLPPVPAPIPPKKRKSSSAATLPPPPTPVAHRLNDPNAAVLHRPKREVHPPVVPRDIGFTDLPKRTRPKKGKDDGTADQLKFCSKLVSELFKKQYWAFASPFYEPVDWQKLEIPSYPKIIKKPMDLSSMKTKLDRGEYSDALKFYADFKLMIRNCFTFNPAGTPVNNAGHQLSDLFEDKWKSLPPLREVHSDNDDFDDDFDEDSDDEHDGAIQSLTQQLESVKSNIAALQNRKKKKKEDKKRPRPSTSGVPKASSSRSTNGVSGGNKKKGKSKAADVDEVLSFEQKRELSETIGTLEGAKLERVIQIIYEGVPEIRDSQDQIELDIDTLPSQVLIKLYNTVMRPIKPKPGGRAAGQRNGTGTGGLKRKSMDEEAEAERIRLLEARIQMFDNAQNGDGVANGGSGAMSSDSDSSGSSDSDSD